MHKILFPIAMVLAFTGCAAFVEPVIVSGDDNEVAIKSSLRRNPGNLAKEHCAKFNKESILKKIESIGAQGFYYFSCR